MVIHCSPPVDTLEIHFTSAEQANVQKSYLHIHKSPLVKRYFRTLVYFRRDSDMSLATRTSFTTSPMEIQMWLALGC
jgi:hypothetical protein